MMGGHGGWTRRRVSARVVGNTACSGSRRTGSSCPPRAVAAGLSRGPGATISRAVMCSPRRRRNAVTRSGDSASEIQRCSRRPNGVGSGSAPTHVPLLAIAMSRSGVARGDGERPGPRATAMMCSCNRPSRTQISSPVAQLGVRWPGRRRAASRRRVPSSSRLAQSGGGDHRADNGVDSVASSG